MAVPTFVDRVTLHVVAGRGGNGVASVHREKFKPLGGPDGGNGGPGGSVILRVDPDVTTLIDYHHNAKRQGEHGGHGAGGHRNGAHGQDIVLPVPDGTVVTDETRRGARRPRRPRHRDDRRRRAAAAGSATRRWPPPSARPPASRCSASPVTTCVVHLELKVVADIGLVGFPSAGKSSLIAALSRARPKIADYPFTTLVPNLGVVKAGDTTFTVADVPGLIEGASEGRGLGHDFLRHIERCAAIVHVVDLATMEPGRNPVGDLDVIEAELQKYGGLEDRPRLVALNKVDVPDGRDMADIVAEDVAERGWKVFAVSASSHEGLRELMFAMAAHRRRPPRRATPVVEAPRIVIRPQSERGGAGVHRHAERTDDGHGWRVRGEKPERWIRQTDFGNDEAVGFLSDRLNRLGVEEKLVEIGAVEGDPVLIGDPANAVVFDFKPGIDAGAQMLGRRGEDQRFSESRPAADRRRAIDEAMPDRAEGEERADVARRLYGDATTSRTTWATSTSYDEDDE